MSGVNQASDAITIAIRIARLRDRRMGEIQQGYTITRFIDKMEGVFNEVVSNSNVDSTIKLNFFKGLFDTLVNLLKEDIPNALDKFARLISLLESLDYNVGDVKRDLNQFEIKFGATMESHKKLQPEFETMLHVLSTINTDSLDEIVKSTSKMTDSVTRVLELSKKIDSLYYDLSKIEKSLDVHSNNVLRLISHTIDRTRSQEIFQLLTGDP